MAAIREHDLRASFDDWFKTQWSTTSAIDWEGILFDAKGIASWVETHIINRSTRAVRAGEQHDPILVQINCYARYGAGADAQAAEVLAAAAENTLRNAAIAVKNHRSGDGTTTLGYVRLTEPRTQTIGDVQGLGGAVRQIAVEAYGQVQAI